MECSSAFIQNRNDDVPIYPDRILFCEDLVNYIINSICGIDFRLHGAERFRENTYNAFSKIVQEGVDYLIVKEVGLLYDTDELNTWDKGTYFSIAAKIEKNFFEEGFLPSQFIRFCVHVTLLSKEFIWKGLSNAANLAAIVIYASLLNYKMFLGGWDSLKLAAKDILDCDVDPITPDTSSTDPSEGGLQHRVSRSSSLDDAERRNIDDDDNVSSNGSQDECNVHAAVSENAPMSNEERHDENLQVPDISIGTQNRELIHDFTSSEMREEDEPVAQQEDVEDELKVNEPVEDKYLRESRASATDRTLEQACKRQKVVSDNESSTSGETSSTIIDRNLYFEYIEIRASYSEKKPS